MNEEADEDGDELGDFEPAREGAEDLLESSLDTHAEGAGSREQGAGVRAGGCSLCVGLSHY